MKINYLKKQIDNGSFFGCKINSSSFEFFNDFKAERFIVSIGNQFLEVEKNVFIDLYINFCEYKIDLLIKKNKLEEKDGDLLHSLFKKMVMLTKNEKV